MSLILHKELIHIYSDVLGEYSSLWQYKECGKSLEITTCHSTATNKFVSVFLTKREDTFIITDGGFIHQNEYYEADPYTDSTCFNNSFEYIFKHYAIKKIDDSTGVTIYYKRTDNPKMIASIILDMCSFIVHTVNITVSMAQEESDKSIRIFSNDANIFLKSKFGDKVDFKQNIIRSSNIRFSAVVRTTQKTHLINYITGSTKSHFIDSINRANMNFQAVHKIYKGHEKSLGHLIGLIDDGSNGSRQGNYRVQYDILKSHLSDLVTWSEKESLTDILNQ